jgi:hypothetical protein
MAEAINNLDSKDDELDLLMLLRKIISFIRDYGKLLLISAAAGLFAGIAIYFTLPKSYSAKMILHSVILTNTEQIEIIDNWTELLQKNELNQVAADFGCDPLLLNGLNSIEGHELDKSPSLNNPNGFVVEVFVKDTGIVDRLQKSIVYGLQNSEYLKARVKVRKANFIELIEKVKLEINKLDSTKRSIENSINNKSKSSSSFIIDVSSVNSQMIGFNEKLLQYQEQLQFVDAIQVVKGFSKSGKPVSHKRLVFFIGLTGGFALGFALALYKILKKKLYI